MWNIFVQSLGDAVRNWRWAVVWTLVNFLAALAISIPVQVFIRQVNGHSLLGERLLGPGLDVPWLLQAIHQQSALETLGVSFVLTVLGGIFVYLVVNVFLTGGLIGLFRGEQGNGAFSAEFFHDCTSYFAPLFGTAMLSWLVYGAILVGIGFFLKYFSKYSNAAITQAPVNRLEIIMIITLVLAFGLVHWFFDYVKVGLVLSEDSHILRHCGLAAVFLWGHGGTALGLYGVTCGLWLVVVGVSTWLALGVVQQGPLTMAAVLVLQQVAMLLRGWMRLVFYAGECRWYQPSPPVLGVPENQISEETSQMM